MPDNPNIEKIPNIVEQIPSTEQVTDTGQSIEQAPEQPAAIEQEPTPVEINLPDDTSQITVPADNTQIVLQQVEEILSKNMDKAFLSMDVATQAKFKVKGEQTGQQITLLLQKGRAGLRKITNLILEWLRIIPQVNKHYIEQEAKIKAENIINMYKNK
jgi:hypothetical protein